MELIGVYTPQAYYWDKDMDGGKRITGELQYVYKKLNITWKIKFQRLLWVRHIETVPPNRTSKAILTVLREMANGNKKQLGQPSTQHFDGAILRILWSLRMLIGV